MTTSAEYWIRHLGLIPHEEEGGHYAIRYVSNSVCLPSGRPAVDTIYYMLTEDSPIGHFHRNMSDIIHFFHVGAPLRYTLISPDGQVERFYLGPDPSQGHTLQHVVPAGWWKATELCHGAFGLLSEAVTPSFRPEERTIATRGLLRRLFNDLDPDLLELAFDLVPPPR